ncbi:hypothetical protein Tco_0990488 [Tanacetum coccineum]|uniref:Uncharacterized protein n=1 Tax=Tanacetum coccineum TaxID=301880 RepID=A0ABQ5EXA1_9ASTR
MWSCEKIFNPIDTLTQRKELFLVVDATRAIPTMNFNLVNVEGFLYLEIKMMCVEIGCVECDCHFEVEIKFSGFDIGEVELSTLDVLQMFVFFLQLDFTLILATLDGLDVCLLGDVIGENDGDEGE